MSRDSLLPPDSYPSTRGGQAETWLAQLLLDFIFQDLLVSSCTLPPDASARLEE